MRKVRCIDCGKSYDYDEDAFCPRCGAFNQPPRGTGSVTFRDTAERRDGLNESGHGGSFLHREYHAEERQRRSSGLEKGSVSSSRRDAERILNEARNKRQAKNKLSVWKVIKWIIVFYILAGVAGNLLSALLWGL